MIENQQRNFGPLDEAVGAFQEMTVPERPPDASVLAGIQFVLGDTLQLAAIPSRTKRGHLMRMIMPSAVVVLLLLACLGWLLLNTTASLALADVVKAAEQHKLVRVTQTQITDDARSGLGTAELKSTVYWDLKAPRFRSELRIGTRTGDALLMDIQDYVKGRWLVTNSAEKTAMLFIINAKDMSCLENLKKLQERKETTSAEETLEGVDVMRYRLAEGNATITLWVDPKTKLPVKMEQELVNPDPEIRSQKWTWTDFEWDPDLKEVKSLNELFNTQPPQDYAVTEIDNTNKLD